MGEAIAEVGYLAGNCQYDGSAWRKSNLLFGYSDRWYEDLSGNASGTSYGKNATPVPEGYIYVIQALFVENDSRAGAYGNLLIYKSATEWVATAYEANLGQYVPLCSTAMVVLKQGDYPRVFMGGCLDGDAISAGVWGYKMKLDM